MERKKEDTKDQAAVTEQHVRKTQKSSQVVKKSLDSVKKLLRGLTGKSSKS